jgi:hypothetical protein
MDSWRNRRTLYMVIRDVGDEDIIIIGYMFSAWGVSGIVMEWKEELGRTLFTCLHLRICKRGR